MAHSLPAHLSHRSALVLFPPTSITAPIEKVRKRRDKHYRRWPPHITLFSPFLASPSASKDSILARIQQATKSIRPFLISLSADPPGVFHHSKEKKTVWLGPSGQSVQQLQAALQAEFAECNFVKRVYEPHLSVGQATTDHGAKLLGHEIRNRVAAFQTRQSEGAPFALEWFVDKVYVIELKGSKDIRFKTVGSIDLEKE